MMSDSFIYLFNIPISSGDRRFCLVLFNIVFENHFT